MLSPFHATRFHKKTERSGINQRNVAYGEKLAL